MLASRAAVCASKIENRGTKRLSKYEMLKEQIADMAEGLSLRASGGLSERPGLTGSQGLEARTGRVGPSRVSLGTLRTLPVLKLNVDRSYSPSSASFSRAGEVSAASHREVVDIWKVHSSADYAVVGSGVGVGDGGTSRGGTAANDEGKTNSAELKTCGRLPIGAGERGERFILGSSTGTLVADDGNRVSLAAGLEPLSSSNLKGAAQVSVSNPSLPWPISQELFGMSADVSLRARLNADVSENGAQADTSRFQPWTSSLPRPLPTPIAPNGDLRYHMQPVIQPTNNQSRLPRWWGDDDEVRRFVEGVRRYGVGNWSAMRKDAELRLDGRKGRELYEKWRTLVTLPNGQPGDGYPQTPTTTDPHLVPPVPPVPPKLVPYLNLHDWTTIIRTSGRAHSVRVRRPGESRTTLTEYVGANLLSGKAVWSEGAATVTAAVAEAISALSVESRSSAAGSAGAATGKKRARGVTGGTEDGDTGDEGDSGGPGGGNKRYSRGAARTAPMQAVRDQAKLEQGRKKSRVGESRGGEGHEDKWSSARTAGWVGSIKNRWRPKDREVGILVMDGGDEGDGV
ncbi:hypothetical protein HDU93_005272 [Gonapodya sp. JEL0774]|nr:hypothetical protein HDU93_005272 [Gonapodya sp. JEL0774]